MQAGTFRYDIEGMRAVAVLLVLGAHSGVPGMAGGFVGVDVFFVISGYLITGILARELAATGRLDLWNFYSRRIRRLLPALVFMVAVTLAAAAVLLSPFEQLAQMDGAGWAVLWVSNLFFAFSGSGYFDAGSETNLFLHTWSLGVEEQFYLVWPILILLIMGFLGQRKELGGADRSIDRLTVLVPLLLLFSILLTLTKPLWGFYLMPSRAWEFGVGALGYFLAQSTPAWLRDSRLGLVGLLMVLSSGLLLHPNSEYPGYRALLPVIGTFFVLVAGASRHATGAGVYHLLRTRLFQFVGNISYSLYLWHWPALVLLDIVVPGAGLGARLLTAVLSVMLAVMTWHLIEKPFRFGRLRIPGARPTLAAAAGVLAISYGAIGWLNHLAQQWVDSPEQQQFKAVRKNVAKIYAHGCDDWYFSARVNVCQYGDRDAEKTAVLLGDSIGAQWFPAIEALHLQDGWQVLVITKSSCPIIDESFFYKKIGRQFTECTIWRDAALDYIRQIAPQRIFIGNARTEFSEDQWIDGSKRVLQRIVGPVDEIFILAPTPYLPVNGPDCLARATWHLSLFGRPLRDCTYPAPAGNWTRIHGWLERVVGEFDNVFLVDMNQLICPGNHCSAARGGVAVFRDSQHLTADYSRSLAPQLRAALEGTGKVRTVEM